MNLFDRFFFDFLGMGLACALVNGALTGKFYTSGKGSNRNPKLIFSVSSNWARSAILLLASGICAWLVIDMRRKLGI
jgi:hypothetical protein